MSVLAYLSRQSVRHGGAVDLFVSAPGPVDIRVAPLFDAAGPVFKRSGVSPPAAADPAPDAFATGFQWPVAASITVGEDWPSGPYAVQITCGTDQFHCFLLVRTRAEERARNLVVVNTNTWQAYNGFGGSSFYRYGTDVETQFGSPDKPRKGSKTLSFQRPDYTIDADIRRALELLPTLDPLEISSGRSTKAGTRNPVEHLLLSEIFVWTWLRSVGVGFDLVTDHDLDGWRIPRSYKNVILACHPEYWSADMFQNLCDWMRAGGNLISLAGNVIHRRIMFKGSATALRLVKHRVPPWGFMWSSFKGGPEGFPAIDAIRGDTVPAQIIGSRYNANGLNTYAPYQVTKPDHWAFKGLGVAAGAVFGERNFHGGGACGYETDASCIGEDPVIAKGMNPNAGGGDIMAHAIGKSRIFSVGSVSFCGSLHHDPIVAGMTRNVLDAFGA